MIITIENGDLCIGNNKMYLCKAGAGNERANIPVGRYEISTQFSHAHGSVLPNATNLGWLGDDRSCDVVLGNVRGNNGVIPCKAALTALLSRIEVAEGFGQFIELEVK